MRSRVVALLGSVSLAFAALGSVALPAASGASSATATVGAPVPSAGCGSSTVAAGETQVNLTWDGEARRYLRHVPPAHDGTNPVPLVFDFHGRSEGAQIHTIHTEFGPYGDAHGFVTIFPQARGTGLQVSWDSRIGFTDVNLFGQILDDTEAALCVDTNRIFVTGLSQGAFMTSAIACVYADRVAAIAPVAGLRNPTGCSPARPVPVRTFHGTADTFVSFDPLAGILAAWAARNGCDSTTTETVVASDVTLVHHPCPVEAPVELYRVEGGGHSWPGSEFSRSIEAVVGPTTFSISATALAWDFFESHPLDGVTYRARYSAQFGNTLGRLATGLGVASADDVVRLGVDGLQAVAEAGSAKPITAPANDGPFQVAITYPAEEAEALRTAAAAWGLDADELHHFGGRIVAVLVYLALHGGG